MSWLLCCAMVLAAIYLLLLAVYLIGWSLQPAFSIQPGFVPRTRISVVIAARNESAHIGDCLRSLLAQDYPLELLEIFVADDFSEDDTAAEVLAFDAPHVRLIRLKDHVADRSQVRSFKKKALEVAISQSSGSLIVTTDADCTASPDWLKLLAAKYEQTGAALIVAPVNFTSNGSMVEVFQSIDFMTMQGITAAAHRLKLGNMSNGANLAFSRTAYEAVEGYRGIDHLASGDDYLLMSKIAKTYPGGIAYIRAEGAVVQTAPQPDWSSFLQQRIRWASKSGKYPDARLTAILLCVYLFNFSFLLLAVAALFKPVLWYWFWGLMACKTIAELIFLWPVSGFFHKRRQLLWFPLLQGLHIVYIILAGFLGYKGSFVWKGRTIE